MKVEKNMEVEKNKEYIVNIIDNGLDGEGIAKINNFTIFVPETLAGEKVKILIIKVNKSFAIGKKVEIIEKSKDRVLEDCETYKRCGGCSLRFMTYEKTLEIKTNMVKNCLRKELKEIAPKVNDIIPMKEPKYYRNKLQFPCGLNKDNKPVFGVFAKRTHEIIETKNCFIQDSLSQKIVKDSFDFLMENNETVYNEKNLKGSLRHIIIRIGKKTNEIMLILVLNEDIKCKEKLAKYITEKYKEIKTIVLNFNKKNTNVILGSTNEVIWGSGYIMDKIGNYLFKISPMSFYQTNPIQTEVLYNSAIKLADIKEDENVLDLYCGIGTIGIFASKYANMVYGIEVVENAVNDAKENAKINNRNNIEFYLGEVENVLPGLLNSKIKNIDVVFVDPPRSGLDNKTIETLKNLKPKKLVYVSCNPATLARDLKLVSDKYEIETIQPVDMFPYTSHVECVALLNLKKTEISIS